MITLLVDGDTVAFIAAAAVQHTVEDVFGFVRPFAQIVEGQACLNNILSSLKQGLHADRVRVFLSDRTNWRHEVLASYKRNRSGANRPLLLPFLRDYLATEWNAEVLTGLEADDCLGIFATEPRDWFEDVRIVVGEDKDFKTIPGLHHTLGKDRDPETREYLTRTISKAQADNWHLVQAFAGDRIDGFEGCPGIGMTRAERILEAPVLLRPAPGVVTRGPRKGQSVTKWIGEPTLDKWACIVSHYEKEGKTEHDALITARLARILRWQEFDQTTGRLTLWSPSTIGA